MKKITRDAKLTIQERVQTDTAILQVLRKRLEVSLDVQIISV